MNALPRHVQMIVARVQQRPRTGKTRRSALAAVAFGVTFGLVCGVTSGAHAQGVEPSPAAVVAARELFREATIDVDAGRFDVALEKFRRVAAVKDTAAVRFNTARCEESLGRLGTALADYESAARLADGDPRSGEIGKMAREHAEDIRPRVPRLTIAPPSPPPPDLSVRLDGAPQPIATLGVALPLDPGPHHVEASGNGATFARTIDLQEASAATIAIELPKSPIAGGGANGDAGAAQPDAATAHSTPTRLPGFVALGLGGALAVTSLVFVLTHNQNVDDLKTQKAIDCTLPGGACPLSKSGVLDDLQTSAKRSEALAIGFGAGAAVALATGTYLVIVPPGRRTGGTKPSPGAPSARIAPVPGGLSVVGSF